MTRVLHYIGLLQFGGSQSFVMEIYRKIDREKLQFDFVTFPNEKSGYYQEIIQLGGKVFESPQFNGRNYFEFITWWNQFFSLHPEYKVFHSHVRSVAALCISIAHKYGCYAIAHSHSTSNGRGIKAIIKNIMQFPIRYQADYMFACSEEAGEWLYGKNIAKRKNYRVIPNAIDAARFNFDQDKRKQVRAELNIEDKFVVGHVGRLSAVKNHEFLVEVFAEIVKKKENAVLLLVGDGDRREAVERKCKQLEVYEKVIFLGSRSNTQDYYQAMDVFVFPSLWEGLGIVVIEAQTAGLPCIVSSCVPKEIDLGIGLICRMGLDHGVKVWADKIAKNSACNRCGQEEAVKKAGYDVTANAGKIQRFYLKIDTKIRNEK